MQPSDSDLLFDPSRHAHHQQSTIKQNVLIFISSDLYVSNYLVLVQNHLNLVTSSQWIIKLLFWYYNIQSYWVNLKKPDKDIAYFITMIFAYPPMVHLDKSIGTPSINKQVYLFQSKQISMLNHTTQHSASILQFGWWVFGSKIFSSCLGFMQTSQVLVNRKGPQFSRICCSIYIWAHRNDSSI